MKILWADIRHIVEIYFKRYKDGKLAKGAGQAEIYSKYYRASAPKSRDSIGARAKDVAAPSAAGISPWQGFAIEAAFNRKSRWDNVSLQVKREAQLATVDKDHPLRAGDQVTSIVHAVRAGVDVARIQVVVEPDFAGRPLYQDLLGWLSSSCAAIRKWKVMSPALGSEGPDSCVIYLTEQLDTPNVTVLVATLKERLGGRLRGLQETPLGQSALAVGIYGFALPNEMGCKLLELTPQERGSAGSTIAAVIDHIAFAAADAVTRGGKPLEVYRERGWEGVALPWAEFVLGKLGWMLLK